MRSSQSRFICQRLYRALVLFKKSRRYLPRSAFGQAIDYALSNWPLLGVYLDDGRLELDNNLVENAIRPTAVGKKNWLFLGDAEARPTQRHPLHHYRELPLPTSSLRSTISWPLAPRLSTIFLRPFDFFSSTSCELCQ